MTRDMTIMMRPLVRAMPPPEVEAITMMKGVFLDA
jgi:hypothetical protein